MRKLRRGLLAAAAGLVACGLAVEMGVRFALFSDSALAKRLGARLRDPAHYFDAQSETGYWILQHRFAAARLRPVPGFDPLLGWRGTPVIDPKTYAHSEEGTLDGKQPVLLYGDSFAHCVTERNACFARLLALSPLGSDYALLNYGVGGYGLDQIYLLMSASVDNYADRDPVVIVGVLIGSDLDRSVLRFRGWPKPRLRVEGGELVDAEPLPGTIEEFLERHPLRVASYAFRLLVRKAGVVPAEWRRRLVPEEGRRDEKRALNRAIVERAHRELEDRGLRHFFLLFHAKNAIDRPEDYPWQEAFLHEVLGELDVPFVGTKADFLEDMARTGRPSGDYFVKDVPSGGHYDEDGNAVALRTILRGLRGEFDQPPGR